MKSLFLKYLIFLSVFAWHSLGQAVTEQPSSGEKTPVPHSSYTEPETGIVFSVKHASYDLAEVVKFNNTATGLVVRYSSEGLGRADIYVYDIPVADIDSEEAFKAHYESLKENVLELVADGRYKSAKLISESVYLYGTDDSQLRIPVALFEINVYGLELESYIYLLKAKNKYVKIRVSYPKDAGEDGEIAMEDFMHSLLPLIINAGKAN